MTKTILSIQSHVAYGYVGNRAAVFPLQSLGYDVHVINTVQFSNHTGYGKWTGDVFPAGHIEDLVNGIAERTDKVDAVLSGYMGDAAIGEQILSAVQRFQPEIYCCDPVMGDTGRGFFVRDGIPAYFKQTVVPRAQIITPNQFELSYLTDISIKTREDAEAACVVLHAQGVRTILLTSFEYEGLPDDQIAMMVSQAGKEPFVTQTQKLPLDPAPNGSGDCTAALFLGHILSGATPEKALEKTTEQIFQVFEKTYARGNRELDIIGARDVFKI